MKEHLSLIKVSLSIKLLLLFTPFVFYCIFMRLKYLIFWMNVSNELLLYKLVGIFIEVFWTWSFCKGKVSNFQGKESDTCCTV